MRLPRPPGEKQFLGRAWTSAQLHERSVMQDVSAPDPLNHRDNGTRQSAATGSQRLPVLFAVAEEMPLIPFEHRPSSYLHRLRQPCFCTTGIKESQVALPRTVRAGVVSASALEMIAIASSWMRVQRFHFMRTL